MPQVVETTRNWHDEYDDPRSALSVRLAVVQDEVSQAATRRHAGPVRLVSVCAGEGRDVIGALTGHPRRHDVSAVLVDIDPVHAEAARRRAAAAGLANVTVVQADASLTDSYAGHAPADIVLVCGVFGNIADADIQNTIAQLPHLCAAGADVIWTRNLGPRDGSANLTPTIRAWFRAAGFRELAFRWTEGGYGIGTHQLASPPRPHEPGRRLFATFKQRW
jgi:hypothetical protein